MKYLITGGTVFVSKFAAAYFCGKGHEVYVLNRGNHPQVEGVHVIKADRHQLNNCLSGNHFDAVLDICAYNAPDIQHLLEANIQFDDYILMSSSAVYPETLAQPFNEKQPVGKNSIWGDYGTNKIAAEKYLLLNYPNAYILRPPYIYGPMQNLYREPFIFDCAEQKRKFYIPKNGKMQLQFFYVEDLCRLIELVLHSHPNHHIFNVGNNCLVDINTYVAMCYEAVGTVLEKEYVYDCPNQRNYFCFHDYEYALDVHLLNNIMPLQTDLLEGLKKSYKWYKEHKDEMVKKPYMDFIDQKLARH